MATKIPESLKVPVRGGKLSPEAVKGLSMDLKGQENVPNPKAVSLNDHEHYHKEEHNINQKVSNRTKIFTSLAAGAVAGAVAKTTIAPLDRTKINFQTSKMQFSFRKATLFIYHTFKKEGFMALYRGNSATMARIVPYAAVQYMSHEQYKLLLLKKYDRKKYLPPPMRMLAGSLAGTTATTLTYPLDMVRARMAITGRDRYSTLRSVFRKTYKEEGLKVMYRGYTPTVIGSAIYSGIGFGVYESLKKFHAEYNKGRTPMGLETWCMGAVAGVCGQCSSYPLDIVRRRMQTAGVTGHTKEYTAILKTARLVYTQEGVKKGLYKGLSMNWIKGPISNGVSFLVFETVHRLLRSMKVFHIDDND